MVSSLQKVIMGGTECPAYGRHFYEHDSLPVKTTTKFDLASLTKVMETEKKEKGDYLTKEWGGNKKPTSLTILRLSERFSLQLPL